MTAHASFRKRPVLTIPQPSPARSDKSTRPILCAQAARIFTILAKPLPYVLSFQRKLESYQDYPSRKQTKTLSLTNNHQPPTTNFFASAPSFTIPPPSSARSKNPILPS